MGAKNIRLQVHPEAKFCRCCGKPTERFTYGTYCTQVGCVEMGHRSREFCEHDGATVRADGTCTQCTLKPLGNR